MTIFGLGLLTAATVPQKIRKRYKVALRQGFNKPLSDNSFDVDDVLVFLKFLWPVMTKSLGTALRNNGIFEETALDYLREAAINSKSQGITVNGGEGILNFIAGGQGNTIRM